MERGERAPQRRARAAFCGVGVNHRRLAADAMANIVDIARRAERGAQGLYPLWVAEHRRVPGIPSAATSVLG